MFYSIFRVEILLKIIEKWYEISYVICYTDYIFWELIFCCQTFYIKEIKSALSKLYVVNQVFLANNVL